MNILHLYKDYYPVIGGIENTVKWLAEAQAADGHNVSVLVAARDYHATTETLNGVTVHKIPRFGTAASTPITPTLPLALWQHRPDIAHIHSPYPPGEFFNALLGRARYSVITYHSDVVKQKNILRFYGPILKRVLQRADLIMPTSANYIETSPFLRPHKAKCRVVPLGIDPARFNQPPLPLAETLKNRLGQPLLLFVGRLRYYKGLDTLLTAMAHVSTGKLAIVGSGPLEADLKAQARQLQLENRVYFAGNVSDDDLPAWFQAADCFVLPSNSRAEAFGLVLLEAMAAGLPLISTELGTGTSFINQHGQTGLVTPPQNPVALAQAINTLLADEPLRRQYGQAALARVRAEFTQDKMVQRVMQVYQELITPATS